MEWTHVLTIVGANLVMLISIIAITINLCMHSDKKMEESRKDFYMLLKEMKDEMKDFHGRMCAIEERNRAKSI